jgi:hypothetical protein
MACAFRRTPVEKENESTNRLLRTIIALLLEQSESFKTLKQKIDFLDRTGLKPVEISKVVGKTNTHVNKELAGIRKSRK